MKKLLNTLYITSSDKYLSLDGENVVVLSEKQEVGRVPLHNLEAIVTFGFTGASPVLMGACAKRNVALSFLSQSGRFLARVSGEVRGNVLLRKKQYFLSEDEEASLTIAKNFITGKVFNARWVLERAARDHAMRLDMERMKSVSGQLKKSLGTVRRCDSMGTLRGIEGEAAGLYFSVFDEMILQQKEDFSFHRRSRRPSLDATNALLSFTYTLLTNMCAAALETVGFDPYVGFMHTDRPGRASLALDLMEELRAVFADRFVLSLINKRMVSSSGFRQKENGAVIMDDDTRKSVLSAWQMRKQEVIRHPFLEEKVEWGMVPYTQALLLARYIRGDLDEYPPFMWK
ncbi:type I-C CRISPR-associated endonuclease Cas1c [Candidatus Merdisoma sp. JLR.KK011]|uniref:type I-C CRISPR-associated endonuclease Cas1c n=1 Tax=Candidatus Merdisoma sp. JLR.KK011 TaxID=3114299 RepID=UPI002FF312F3